MVIYILYTHSFQQGWPIIFRRRWDVEVSLYWQKFASENIFRGIWLKWSRFNWTGGNPIRWC